MDKGRWRGGWEGGRLREGENDLIYWIEKQIGGHRYRLSLGECGLDAARIELSRFMDDPVNYLPPAQRIERSRREKVEREHKVREGAVVITADLIEAFAKAALDGRHGKQRTPNHVKDTHRYLSAWAVGPLAMRDLRTVTLRELNDALDNWPTARAKRIVALKAFTKFLRLRGSLTSQNDPTRDLVCLQPRPPTEAEKARRIYTPEQLTNFYRHLDRQEIRDVVLVRSLTGMHFTEIRRIATGQGVMRRVDLGEITGTVSVQHKSGHTHVQSLDARTYFALERIVQRGGVPDPRVFIEAGRRSVIAQGFVDKDGDPIESKRVRIENLRHTFATLAARQGRLVQPRGAGGIPDTIVSQLIGHTDVKTTRTFYLHTEIPPLIVMNLEFHHPDDPALPEAAEGTRSKARKPAKGSK